MSDYMRSVLCFAASSLAKALRRATPTDEQVGRFGLGGWNTTADWLWKPGNYALWANFSASAGPLSEIPQAAMNLWFAPTGSDRSVQDGLWPHRPEGATPTGDLKVGVASLVQLHWQLASPMGNATAFDDATNELCNHMMQSTTRQRRRRTWRSNPRRGSTDR